LNPDWLLPDWPAPSGVRAVFTTRQGGFSSVPFDTMNLGDHVGDAPHKVAANRAALQSAIGSRPVFLKQVHGREVLRLGAGTAEGQAADACITSERHVACTIMVADCLPVLLTTEDGSRVAAAHAGWRGLAGAGTSAGERAKTDGRGVLESIFESFSPLVQAEKSQPAMKIIAWLGPCIGPSAFEVGEEVKTAFELIQPQASHFFVPCGRGKYRADLAGLARLRLQGLGVADVYGNDGGPAWCTYSNPSKFFSHRRDAAVVTGNGSGNGFGTTGRMAAAIWRI